MRAVERVLRLPARDAVGGAAGKACRVEGALHGHDGLPVPVNLGPGGGEQEQRGQQSRGGAEGLHIGFLHPKSTLGVLTEFCCK